MYIKLLNEAIGEQKGDTEPKKTECTVDLDISANIPEKYIPSLSHRLGIYRRIADIKTLDDKRDVVDELIDRFGDPPSEVLGLIDIALLKGAAERNGIYEISGDRQSINFYVKNITPENAGDLIKKLGQGTLLVPAEPMHFTVKLKAGQNKKLRFFQLDGEARKASAGILQKARPFGLYDESAHVVPCAHHA